MIRRLMVAAVLTIAAAVIRKSLPDLNRYLKIREM